MASSWFGQRQRFVDFVPLVNGKAVDVCHEAFAPELASDENSSKDIVFNQLSAIKSALGQIGSLKKESPVSQIFFPLFIIYLDEILIMRRIA